MLCKNKKEFDSLIDKMLNELKSKRENCIIYFNPGNLSFDLDNIKETDDYIRVTGEFNNTYIAYDSISSIHILDAIKEREKYDKKKKKQWWDIW